MFETDFLGQSTESKEAYQKLIVEAAQIVCQSLPSAASPGGTAAELAKLIPSDFLPQTGLSSEEISETLRTVVTNSVNVSHPRTAAHLHCPPLLAALAAEVVISALNQSMDSFDQAPIATIVEQKLIRWLCGEAGFPATADGTFTTGGSQSNYMGLLLVRDAFLKKRWNWSAQKSGLPPEADRLRILCSEVAHFTVEKSASQLGLGTDSVIRVDVDEHFRMKPAALRSALQGLDGEGLLPMAVVATAGTTDFGSIDPLSEIATIARETNTWLHVDAAYGGALLFSSMHRNKLAAIETADSVTIDFHKLFWQPIPCSAFLLRDAVHFDVIKFYADYLNPESHEDEGVPDLVTTSLLTSRRFDSLKLWISFQWLGREKLGKMIDRTIALAAHTAQLIRNTPQLELMAEPQLSTVIFRYVPSAANVDADLLNNRIRRQLFDLGQAVIGHTRVRNRQCLKFTCMNPAVSDVEMEDLLKTILELGRQFEAEKDRV
ncbi:MAG: aspartate aminotransferase family protein [Candidatus Sulfotelmatobacter sp.]